MANWSSFYNNGTTESRTHNSVNELIGRGATSLTYDANGNLTNDDNQKYVWDELNRLIQVKDSGNNVIVDYYYNADNLRVEKHHAGGAKEQFYYDSGRVVEETDGSQNLVREYINGAQYVDELILVANTVGASVIYNYYMTDLRYNVYGFLDSSGAVVERAKYDGFGKRTLTDPSYSVITTPVVDQSYGYTGIRHDTETGLQYYRARYFDNSLGRFINRDPIGYFDGMNLYRGYFIPTTVDPDGKYFRVRKFNVPLTRIQFYFPTFSGSTEPRLEYVGNYDFDEWQDEVNKCWNAQVWHAKKINLTLLTMYPTTNTNANGEVQFDMQLIQDIVAHEDRRISAYEKGYNNYFIDTQDTKKHVHKCGIICKPKKGQAKKLLNDYLVELEKKANTEFWKYEIEEQGAITYEQLAPGAEELIIFVPAPKRNPPVLLVRTPYGHPVREPKAFVPPECKK